MPREAGHSPWPPHPRGDQPVDRARHRPWQPGCRWSRPPRGR